MGRKSVESRAQIFDLPTSSPAYLLDDRMHYTLFETAIGTCGVVWGARGLTGANICHLTYGDDQRVRLGGCGVYWRKGSATARTRL